MSGGWLSGFSDCQSPCHLFSYLLVKEIYALMEKVEKRHNQTAEKRRIQARELLEK